MEDLEAVLVDVAHKASVLRESGHGQQAAQLEKIVERVRHAAAPCLTWLSEREAMLQSGHSAEWLRKRYPEWARAGTAMKDVRRGRLYLEIVVPRRLDRSLEREIAARVEREMAG